MRQIGDYLERFKKIASRGTEGKQAVLDALRVCGIQVAESTAVTIRAQSVSVRLHGAQKTELYLKKQKVLLEFKKHPLLAHIQEIH
jgi:hypothetical protein